VLNAGENEYLSFPDFLKAVTPAEEDGARFVYLEASNQARDLQGEVVLAKALRDSAEYFLRYGNLDIDHKTQLGPQAGSDYLLFEIGQPVDVRASGESTWVKGSIYQGDTKTAEHANHFWDSITKMKPAKRWYPSVGGSIQERGVSGTIPVVKKVRWTNIGFSATPVNPAVPQVSTVPFGALAKCWGPGGLDLRKALEAGYGTDSADLTGGAALRSESLDHKLQNYWDFRDRLSGDLLSKRVGQTAPDLISHANQHYGLTKAEAAEWTERFLADLRDGLNSKRTH